MKNTVLKFKDRELEMDFLNFGKVKDYHGKKTDIQSISSDLMAGMLSTFEMKDDDRIERVSNKLYGTTDYWDILVLLNGNDPFFDMPYNEDILMKSIENKIDFYQNYVYSNAPLIQEAADKMTARYTEEVLQNNENMRILTIVKPSRMSDFISLLKDKDFL